MLFDADSQKSCPMIEQTLRGLVALEVLEARGDPAEDEMGHDVM